MKLKQISCTQFAGIRDCEVSLKDGINVICGKNESGKSTLVNLISRTLFQNTKLDGRRDKEFADLYFPAARRGSAVVGDFVDGRLTIETEQGTYKLTKEWGADARCTLSTPDGVIRDQAAIDAALKEILLYGEGVYADLLLSSQRSTDTALQTILDAGRKTEAKRELSDVVSQAFAESGGISIDALEQAIEHKIEELAGKHWDYDREAPLRKAGGGRHQKQVGEVLAAYYALEDAKAVLEELSRLEQEADRAAADYAAKDAAAEKAQRAYEDFRVYAGRLALQNERKKEVLRLDSEIAKCKTLLTAWPEAVRQAQQAKQLQAQHTDCLLLERYEAAKTLYKTQQELLEKIGDKSCPAPAEINGLRAAQRRISGLENKLCGMNLAAALKLAGGHTAEIRSLRTGKLLSAEDGNMAITEAVTLTVPGVLELQLAPADVDVAAVEEKIREERQMITELFARYAVDSLEELEQLKETLSHAGSELERAQNKLQMLLEGTAYEELEAAAKELPGDMRQASEIERDIATLCRGVDLARFAAAAETRMEGYEKEYGDIAQLEMRCKELSAARQEAVSEIGGDDIPAQYRSVSEPESYLQQLHEALRQTQQSRENALTAKTAAISRSETYRQNCPGDPAETVEKAQNTLNEKKTLLAHWMHIAEVFRKQKEAVRNDPMQDIAEYFEYYLSLLSGGGVTSEFPEKDKLNIQIYSRERLLDHSKLSEGTKEIVSLAFRLAVLEHLFPEGGGLMVLDDPFTDMDAERMAQACTLVKECAKRHQIIFLTCREEYLPMLEGTPIYL